MALLGEYFGFFSRDGLGSFGFRWLHILAGITWIGLLYYFNFVQVPALAEYGDDGRARNLTVDKVARRALWWFRWSAFSTFVTGILITIVTKNYFFDGFGKSARGLSISTGMLLGIIMMLNVWGVIWRNQKVVLANAVNVLNGGAPDPNAAAAGRKAFMASRQNVVFSVAMLFFMVFTSHSGFSGNTVSSGRMGTYWLIALIIIAVLELNALGLMPWKTEVNKGLNKLYDGGVQGTLIAAFGVWVIFLILTEVLLNKNVAAVAGA